MDKIVRSSLKFFLLLSDLILVLYFIFMYLITRQHLKSKIFCRHFPQLATDYLAENYLYFRFSIMKMLLCAGGLEDINKKLKLHNQPKGNQSRRKAVTSVLRTYWTPLPILEEYYRHMSKTRRPN